MGEVIKKVYFIARDANWQLYRNEILTSLGNKYDLEIKILTTGKLKTYITDNCRLKYLIFKNTFNDKRRINFFPGALSYILNNKPDCVIGQNGALNLTEYLALLLCKLKKIKFVWWTRAFENKPVKNKFFRKIRQVYVDYFLLKADSIIVYSSVGYDALIKLKFPKERIFIADNTLDTDRLLKIKLNIQRNFNRDQFIYNYLPKAKTGDKFILFTGRINIYKKVQNLVLAADYLIKKFKGFHVIIIGEGDQKEKCEELTKKLNLENQISFLGPIYEEDIVNQYFELSDIYCIPGQVGLGIVHGFCFGLPILTENVNYHSAEIQFLKDGYNGYFIEEGNITALSHRIYEILADDDLRKHLSLNAIETAKNEASIDAMLHKFYSALCVK